MIRWYKEDISGHEKDNFKSDIMVLIILQLVDKLNTDESAADIQMDYEDVSKPVLPKHQNFDNSINSICSQEDTI